MIQSIAAGLAAGAAIGLIVALARWGRIESPDAAHGPLGRLRYSRLAGHRSGAPRPGQLGPGLRALPASGDESFWAIVAPFTPDDYIPPSGLLEAGRSATVECQLERRSHTGRWAKRQSFAFAQTRATFGLDDAGLEPAGRWFTVTPTPGAWTTIDTSKP